MRNDRILKMTTKVLAIMIIGQLTVNMANSQEKLASPDEWTITGLYGGKSGNSIVVYELGEPGKDGKRDIKSQVGMDLLPDTKICIDGKSEMDLSKLKMGMVNVRVKRGWKAIKIEQNCPE